ncbi:hypothetical protein [Marinicrinis lubricantis]|uniref:Uncharacterized protein n=1 Tax=Marinicrinis lubricantis TaxID=2086470 RepID=A0ABW1IRS2_9BACL
MIRHPNGEDKADLKAPSRSDAVRPKNGFIQNKKADTSDFEDIRL